MAGLRPTSVADQRGVQVDRYGPFRGSVPKATILHGGFAVWVILLLQPNDIFKKSSPRLNSRVPNARVRVKSQVSKLSSRVGLESESRTRVLQHW